MTAQMLVSFFTRVTIGGIVLLLLLGGACALHLVQDGPMPPSAKHFGQAWGAVFFVTMWAAFAGAGLSARLRRPA